LEQDEIRSYFDVGVGTVEITYRKNIINFKVQFNKEWYNLQ